MYSSEHIERKHEEWSWIEILALSLHRLCTPLRRFLSLIIIYLTLHVSA
jgi:hypothetical protein